MSSNLKILAGLVLIAALFFGFDQINIEDNHPVMKPQVVMVQTNSSGYGIYKFEGGIPDSIFVHNSLEEVDWIATEQGIEVSVSRKPFKRIVNITISNNYNYEK